MVRTLLYSFLTRSGVALLNFLVLVLSARYLGVQTRGEISVLILNIAVIQLICEIYTGYSLVHMVKRVSKSQLVFYGLLFILFISVSVNLLLYVSGRQIPGESIRTWLLSVVVLLHSFFCVLILGSRQLKVYALLSLLQPFILFSCLMIFVFFGSDYTLSVYFNALFISFGLSLMISAYLNTKWTHTTEGKRLSFWKIITRGTFFQLSVLFALFINRYSYYILPFRSQVGIYSTACALCEATLIVAFAITPFILSSAFRNSPGQQVVIALLKCAIFLETIGLLVLLVLPQRAYILLLGSGFASVDRVMLYYAPSVILQTVLLFFSNFYAARGKTLLPLIVYGTGAGLTFFLAPSMIQAKQTTGAALTANISYSVATAMALVIFVRKEKIHWMHCSSLRSDLVALKSLWQKR